MNSLWETADAGIQRWWQFRQKRQKSASPFQPHHQQHAAKTVFGTLFFHVIKKHFPKSSKFVLNFQYSQSWLELQEYHSNRAQWESTEQNQWQVQQQYK